MDENNNNGIDNPTWFYSSESIIDVKHDTTIKTKYIHFELKYNQFSSLMVRARSRGHNLSSHHQTLSIYETHQIPVLKWDHYHQTDNILLVETFRIDFILLSVSALCITAYIITLLQHRGGGRVRPGVNKHFTIEVSSARSHANMTPDQDQQPCIIDCWFRIYVIGVRIIRMGKLINCRLSSVNLARIGEFMSTFYTVVSSLIFTPDLINWNKDGWS